MGREDTSAPTALIDSLYEPSGGHALRRDTTLSIFCKCQDAEICVEHGVGSMSGSSKRPFHRRGTSVRLAPASLLDRHGLLEMREDDRPRAYHVDF